MTQLSRTVLFSILFLSACQSSEPPPSQALLAYATIDPSIDTNWTAIPRMATRGCAIVAIDAGDQLLKVVHPNRHVTSIGRKGDGKGEYRFPRSFAVGPNGTITVYDAARRRVIRFSASGEVLLDQPLGGGIWGHKPMGKLLATPKGLIDYWFADKVSDWYVSDSVLEHSPLVEEIGFDGVPTGRGWGRPTVPEDSSAYSLRWLLQQGDADIWNDSLFVLRHSTGTIEVYSISEPSSLPVRQFRLKQFRKAREPKELGGKAFRNYYGELRVANPSELRYEALTSAIALSHDGRIYVVSLLDSHIDATMPWPREALTIYDRVGNLESAYALMGRSTVAAGLMDDGTLALLGNPTEDPDGTYVIQLFRVPGATGDLADCGWAGVANRKGALLNQ